MPVEDYEPVLAQIAYAVMCQLTAVATIRSRTRAMCWRPLDSSRESNVSARAAKARAAADQLLPPGHDTSIGLNAVESLALSALTIWTPDRPG